MIRTDGQLYYPVTQLPDAPWVPEYFGNAALINGKLLPYLDVQPRKYRFRILNASNARFYFLSLENGQPFQQIGTDQGLLPAPVDCDPAGHCSRASARTWWWISRNIAASAFC